MIQINVPQKLSSAVLSYLILRWALTIAIILIIAIAIAAANTAQLQQYFAYKFLIAGGAIFLVLLNLAYMTLWWKLFEYTIGESHIKIRSGIIFRTEKDVNFNDIQSANAVFGPLLALFDLRHVRGFTSSPEQIIITSSKSGTHTRHVPDIQIILDKQTAGSLLEMIRKGDIQKVQSVS